MKVICCIKPLTWGEKSFDLYQRAFLKRFFYELDEQVVSSILEHTTAHGAIPGKTQTKTVKYYNLDAIIAVGYRVNSKRATQFRIWATSILKESAGR